jgi:hypothetical protein
MKLFDRLTQSQVELKDINQPVVFSRYLDTSNNFLVPCDNLIENIADDLKVSFIDNKFINNNSSLISNSFIDIKEDLSLIDTIADVSDIIPMLRNFDKRLELTDYDNFVHEHLFHLEEICRQPAYHLSRQETKVNISRAKRITVKSINHLAAHSEDWARRRIRGVEPKNILSETIEYDLQIYENKVTAKLIDKLLKYCADRIFNDIEVVENFKIKIDVILNDIAPETDKENFWYKKRNRDFSKIASLLETIDKSMKQLEILKEYILKIQNRLFALLNTNLYIANKNNILSNVSIERTNLFDNHQHYRYVKIIWNKSFSAKSLSCEEIKDNNQLIINAFVDFSMVLIIRSLLELKFVNVKQDSIDKFEMTHKQYLFNISLTKNYQSIIEVTINNKTIKFIPLLGEMDIEKINLNDNEYILTPFKISTLSRSIEITPDDINSEERITKILFKTILTEYVASYLYPINSQLISQFAILKEWLLKQSDIVVNNGQQGKLDLYVKKYINDQEYKAFVSKVNEQKNNLPQHKIRKKQQEDLDKISNILQVSKEHFDKFFTCLGCDIKDKKRLISNSDGFIYKCTNTGCEVRYGRQNTNIFYEVKNIKTINGNLEDKIGYENISIKQG